MGCLAASPADRPQDADEVLAELKRKTIPKWPFVTAGLVMLVLAAVIGLVRPVRQWVTDLIWPPSVRLAVLPYAGPQELAEIGKGALEDVAARIQQSPGGRRTVAVIPASRTAEMRLNTPQQARDALHATHALKVTVHREADNQLSVQATVVDANSQLPVKELTARYPRDDLSALPAALTGLVRRAFRLQEPAAADKLSPAATEPYLKGIYFLNRDVHSFDEAIAQFQQAAQLDPSSALPPAGLALSLLQKFDATKQQVYRQQAQEFIRTAQARNPDSARVLLAAGRVSEVTSQYLKALQDYQRAQELEPRNVDALLGLASTYEALQDPDQAVAAYRRAEELDPEYYRPYHMLGSFYFRHGRLVESADQFRQMIVRAPGLPDSYFSLAAALIELERYEEAEKALQTSLKIRETPEALNNLGAIRFRQGRFEEAAAFQKRALAYEPNRYFWLLNVADGVRLAGHPGEARLYYQQVRRLVQVDMTLNPQSAPTRSRFAYTSAQLGDQQRALDEIRQAVNQAPDDNEVLTNALKVYVLLGKPELAIEVLRGLAPGTLKELMRDPDLADFFRDPRYKQQMIDKGGQ